MNLPTILFSLSGTISRAAFWTGFGISIGILFVSGIIDAATEGTQSRVAGLIAALVLQLVGLIIWFMIAIKRCRTLAIAPWWSLLLILPVIGLVWLVIIGIRQSETVSSATDGSGHGAKAPEISLTSPRDSSADEPNNAISLGRFATVAVWFGMITMAFAATTVFSGMFARHLSQPALDIFRYDMIAQVLGICLAICTVCGLAIMFTVIGRNTERASSPWMFVELPVGCLLAAVGLAGLFLAFGAADVRGLTQTMFNRTFANYALAGLAMGSFSLALFSRSPGTAAGLTAPIAFTSLAALLLEASIARAMLWLVPFFLVIGIVALICALAIKAPARVQSVAIAFAAGCGAQIFAALVLELGKLTITELAAITLPFAFAASLLIHHLAGRDLGSALSRSCQAAAMIAVVSFIFFAVQMASVRTGFASHAILDDILPDPVAIVFAAGAIALAAFLIGPWLAVAILAPAFAGTLMSMGLAAETVVAAIALASICGYLLRIGRFTKAGLWPIALPAALCLLLAATANWHAPVARFLDTLLPGY